MSVNPNDPDGWDFFRRMARVVVPDRAEQYATLLCLIPFSVDEAFQVVELGCGEGYLAEALLDCFPKATYVALDGSREMLALAQRRLARQRKRVRVGQFQLEKRGWRKTLEGAHCVISSLCVHHLDGLGKRLLFEDVAERSASRAALLIADLVAPTGAGSLEIAASAWESSVMQQALSQENSDDLVQEFFEKQWNIFRHPDPEDHPSPLFQQLLWMQQSGFERADCFWLQAGHAVYGAFKGAEPNVGRLSRTRALASAHHALEPSEQASPKSRKKVDASS